MKSRAMKSRAMKSRIAIKLAYHVQRTLLSNRDTECRIIVTCDCNENLSLVVKVEMDNYQPMQLCPD